MKIKDLELIVVGVFLYCYSTIELLETLAAKHSAMAHYPVLFIHPWFTTPPQKTTLMQWYVFVYTTGVTTLP